MPSDAPIPIAELDRRVDAILGRVRALRPAEVRLVGVAVETARRERSWSTAEAFWLVNTWQCRPSRGEAAACKRMWAELYPAVAFALGEDVDAPVEAPKGFLRWFRIPPSRESAATDLVERVAGAEGHAAALGIWNAACAALLYERLPAELAMSLAAMWQAAGLAPLGPTART